MAAYLRLFVFLSIGLSRVDTDFFIILLESSEIFSGFRELTLLHTFTDVPVDEGSLCVHKIELMVESREDFSDGSGVGDHAHSSHDLGEVTAGNDGGRLVVDTALETSGAPVDELDGSLGLDGGDRGVDILGDDVTSVHQAASHVLTVSGIALDHHGGRLEDGVGDLSNGELLVVGLLGRDDGGVRRQHEVDSGVGHQVGLELSDVDVEGAVESEGGSQRGNDLGNESVQVGVGGSLNVQLSSADVVDSLIVKHNGDIGVLEERVSGQNGVVGLNDGCGDLGRGVNGETQLGLLAVVNGQPLEEERSETGSGSSTDRREDQESLETGAVVSQLSDSVKAKVDDLATDGVVTSGEVVSGILLTRNQLLRVEELSVRAGSDLVNDGGLQIKEDTSGDVLASAGLAEEGVESIITASDGLIRGHLTVRLDTVLEAEQLPAGVSDLDSGLTDVD